MDSFQAGAYAPSPVSMLKGDDETLDTASFLEDWESEDLQSGAGSPLALDFQVEDALVPHYPATAPEASLYSSESSIPEMLGPLQSLRFSPAGYRKGSTMDSVPSVGVGHLSSNSTTVSLQSSLYHSLRKDTLSKHYELGSFLGRGSYGCVREARCINTGKLFAVKSIQVKGPKEAAMAEVEISSISEFDHPNLVKLNSYFIDGSAVHMVMNLCHGGTLRDAVDDQVAACSRVADQFEGGLPSRRACAYIFQMLSGLVYLHHNGFVHRDIKPENYMLATMKESSPLQLGDFGFTVRIGRSELLTRRVGSPHTIAPEVRKGAYGQPSDLWSMGVCAFFTCTGTLPFTGGTEQYQKEAEEGQVKPSNRAWADHAKRVRELVLSLLCVDADARPTAKQVLSHHPWLKNFASAGAPGCCVVS